MRTRQISSSSYYSLFLERDGTVLECGAYEPVAGRHVIDDAGTGSEPLLVVVEVAEELRPDIVVMYGTL